MINIYSREPIELEYNVKIGSVLHILQTTDICIIINSSWKLIYYNIIFYLDNQLIFFCLLRYFTGRPVDGGTNSWIQRGVFAVRQGRRRYHYHQRIGYGHALAGTESNGSWASGYDKRGRCRWYSVLFLHLFTFALAFAFAFDAPSFYDFFREAVPFSKLSIKMY